MDNREGTRATLLTQPLEVQILADRWRVERSPHVFEQPAPTSPPAWKVFLPDMCLSLSNLDPAQGHAKVFILFSSISRGHVCRGLFKTCLNL